MKKKRLTDHPTRAGWTKLLRVMKLTVFLVLILVIDVSASLYSQNSKVTVKVENGTINEIFNKIEEQSEYRFFYQNEQISDVERKSIDVSNKDALELVSDLLGSTDLTYKLVDLNIIIFPSSEKNNMDNAFQQQKTVTGKVTDASGATLPGVSVVIKGTTTGLITDANGNYSLSGIPANATLQFSFVGMKMQEIAVGGKSTINVTLAEETIGIEEVVAVGYGTQSRRNVTGSVTKVDMKQIENMPSTNAAQALRGRVAGLQYTDNGRPGQTGNFLIRGQRSISASNNPLVVLDGIIFEGGFNNINQGDIESVEVLKDASSTAIYGARAANGVILVTSKTGTTEKPTIRFNTSYGISDWSYKPRLLTPERYVQKILDFRREFGLASDPAQIASYMYPTEAQNYTAGKTIDPWDVVSQSASTQNYELSVSGLSGKTNYFISANYNDEKGLIYNDNSKRKSVRVNFKNKINDWLTTGLNVQYAERDASGIPGNMANAYRQSPFASVWLDEAKTDPNPLPTEDTAIGSIIFDAIKNKNEEITRNLFANFYGIVDFTFIKGLSYRINFSPGREWYDNNNFSPIYQKLTLNNKGTASRQSTRNLTWVLENIVNYKKQVGKNHNFDLTLLYGRSQSQNNTLFGSGIDFTGSSDVNGWNNLSLAKVQTIQTSASQVDNISSMVRLNYRFKDRYLCTLTSRRDGSSVFGANNKFGTFPSAALAWIVSEEPFFKTIPTINLLKIRTSYGSVGNQAISAYQSLTQQGQVKYVFGDGGSTSTGIYPANLATPNLGWETTTTANIAAEFELWQGRVGGTVEYYNMDTKDLLLTRALPSPSGFASTFMNVGATSNKGVEVSLNTVNLSRGKLKWSSNLVFSTNKNKIVHLYHSDVDRNGIEDDDIGNQWFIGKPISVAYDYKVVGVYQQGDQIPTGQSPGYLKLQDLQTNGIDPTDRQILGTLQPKYRWGFSNTIKYGNFNLMVMINALTGWLGNNTNLGLEFNTGTLPDRFNFMDVGDGWWTPENKSNTRSSLVYKNPYNHRMWQSRDFLRVQEVLLSYDVPGKILKSININNLTGYVSCRNLYTLTGWQNMDPESGIGDASAFPVPRTFTIGLKTSF
jgi:TonB-linked SusC/RagA family outer membrane protein